MTVILDAPKITQLMKGNLELSIRRRSFAYGRRKSDKVLMRIFVLSTKLLIRTKLQNFRIARADACAQIASNIRHRAKVMTWIHVADAQSYICIRMYFLTPHFNSLKFDWVCDFDL